MYIYIYLAHFASQCLETMRLSADFASVFGNAALVSAFRIAVFGNGTGAAFPDTVYSHLAQAALAAPERGLELIAICGTRRRRQLLLRLQFATCVSRSFVSLPLVKTWRWICMAALRCLRCSSLLLSAGHSYLCLWLKEDAALFALELAMFVGRSRVPSTLVWRWMVLRCLRCSSLRCRQELRTFASSKMDVSAQSALQLAMFEKLRLSGHFASQCLETLPLPCQRVSRHSAVHIDIIFWNAYISAFMDLCTYEYVHQKDIYIYIDVNFHIAYIMNAIGICTSMISIYI